MTFGTGHCLRLLFELFGERFVIEEDIGIVELVVPGAFEVTHCAQYVVQLLVADECDKGGIGTGGIFTIGGVVVILCSPQIPSRFAGS